MVDLNVEGLNDLHKQTFFYYVFGSFVIINIVLRIAGGVRQNMSEDLNAWVRAIIFIINFYLATIIGFVGVMNNTNHINPSSYEYLNYLGPVFLVIWIIGVIFFIAKRK